MSQLDLTQTLRAARPVAPAELRERVRLVAAQAAPPPRRSFVTWRRALVVAVPVAAAIAAGVLVSRPSQRAAQPVPKEAFHAAAADTAAPAPLEVQSSAKRVQRVSTYLELRVPTTAALSHATKQALTIATSLGGYLASSNVNASGKTGYAEIKLKIPKPHVQEAVRRLSALGRIVSENVRVQDLQAGLNATDRLIARLQRNLAALRTQEQTPAVQRRIVQLTAQVQRLQRARAATLRTARYATVDLTLSTPRPEPAKPPHHGPLHGLGAAFRWIGIGLVYAIAIAAPFAAVGLLIWFVVRTVRRRREDALLSRP